MIYLPLLWGMTLACTLKDVTNNNDLNLMLVCCNDDFFFLIVFLYVLEMSSV